MLFVTTYDVVSIKFFSMCGSSFLTRTSKPVTLCNTLKFEIKILLHEKGYKDM